MTFRYLKTFQFCIELVESFCCALEERWTFKEAGGLKELDIERAHRRSEESARRASTSVDGRKGAKEDRQFQKNQK